MTVDAAKSQARPDRYGEPTSDRLISRGEPFGRLARPPFWVGRTEDGSSVVPRLATAAALAFSVLLPVIELGRIWLYAPRSNLALAIAGTVAYLPLHLRHVVHGLRGTRPAHAGWSLGAMALIMGIAALSIGAPWGMMLASLGASVLLVVRPPWLFVLWSGVVAAPLLWGINQGPDPASGGGAYLAFSVAFRSITLFVMVWLVAATRQLHTARAALSDDAVLRERRRIESDLGQTVGVALERIVDDGQRAADAIDTPAVAEPLLRSVVDGSRRALAGARRTVGSYRQVTVRSELEAARTLLASAGIEAQLVAGGTDEPAPEMVDVLRSELRSMVSRLLRDPPARCTIELRDTPQGPRLDLRIGPPQDATGAHRGVVR